MRPLLLLVIVVAVGCASEPPPEAAQGQKLTAEQAQQYKSIVPGSRKSQQAGEK